MDKSSRLVKCWGKCGPEIWTSAWSFCALILTHTPWRLVRFCLYMLRTKMLERSQRTTLLAHVEMRGINSDLQ